MKEVTHFELNSIIIA